jgi:TonB family protein
MNRGERKLLGVLFTTALITVAALSGQDKTGDTMVKGADQRGPVRTVTVNGVAEPVYRKNDGITPPRLIYGPDPEYSDKARKRKIEGVVTLGLVVTSVGTTTDIRVLNGRGYGLDEKAIEAVRRWKFQPATKDGKPVSVGIAVEIMFRMLQNR